MAAIVNDSNFNAEVLESDIPVLVDFFATWCGPCRMLAPVVAKLAEEMAGKVKVVKVDIDESPEVTEKYEIMAVPTLMIFKNGQLVNQMTGVQPIDVIRQALQ
ncbi:MAG: thioredoxin [Lachnospiraceae bacterium]